ncbi:MAG: GNAT family N-acetyltransferase [Oscillospiraceae bacterium]|jgi:ribosomal protein S18 acetylase RimI-like enzyme|nr:GNAT family N-acetyltransferase [Oscillospiraceae bacterium]
MMIRKANFDDIERIKELYLMLDKDAELQQPEHFICKERTKESIEEIINGKICDFLIIENENKIIIGFSLVYEKETPNISLLKKQKYVYIQDFIIDKKYRKQGFGKRLLNGSKEWGKKRGLEFLRLSVIPKNEIGIRFYRENGMVMMMHTFESEL